MLTTPQSPIGWNFNKIFVDKEGRPWTDEILPADDFGISPILDKMLATAGSDTVHLVSEQGPSWTSSLSPFVIFAAIGIASLVAHKKISVAQSSREEGSCYLQVE